MKKNIIKIIALALSIGCLGSIQATPFRRLAACIGTTGYWGTIVGLPAYNSAMTRRDINYFVEKEAIPVCSSYRNDILALAHQHGINDLDEVTLKQHPFFPFAMAAPNNTIVINPLEIEAAIQHDNLTADAFVGALLHEKRHIDRKHVNYFPVIAASIPFALHCVKEVSIPTKPSMVPPSITRSLLRIPLAGALYALAQSIKLGMYKCLEKDADAAMKDKPVLARATAAFFRKVDKNQREDFQEDGEALADIIGIPQAKSTLSYLLKLKHEHLSPHPTLLTRADYLERWADEAEHGKA